MKIKLTIILSLIVLAGCSASYEELKKTQIKKPQNLSEYLVKEYKNKAEYEALKMHDWNSAKLYSEKALLALKGKEVLPENVTYWDLPEEKVNEINRAHKNLMAVYSESKISDPHNLAIAISSLDCWSEQQEENWQTWDINKCKNDFLKSLHIIYEKITLNENSKKNLNSNLPIIEDNNKSIALVTKNKKKEIMQIIYFDFDEAVLSNVSINTLKNFIIKHHTEITKYIIVGHTDTKGTKEYNNKLSLKRAITIKNNLINQGINDKNITLLGKGEELLAVPTPDEVAHPANRRAEIKISN
ncbi:MAG: hypothetical protein CFH15_00227 [Alphaproteobacteria bacterium MarineAlpha5_Bin5]|nr:MAG: hypothetical protein CFH15_00227 [Alphaproteobacteria bacterium MarineAlpha5_Bin5]